MESGAWRSRLTGPQKSQWPVQAEVYLDLSMLAAQQHTLRMWPTHSNGLNILTRHSILLHSTAHASSFMP